MFTVKFWKDSAERAIRTLAQSFVATITVGTSLIDIDWQQSLGIAGTAALLSVLTSVAASGRGGDASLLASGGGKHEA